VSKGNRFLVHAVFIYTCFEGFVVNLTYPSVVAYLLKDVLILMIYASLMSESRPSIGSLRRMSSGVLVFGLVMCFYLVMPTRVSFVAELVALKQRLFYIPLMYVGYFYTRTPEDVGRLIRLLMWLAVPTAGFGIYLYFAGPGALRALGGNYSAVFYSTSGASGITFWRVPGTFTSPGQFALYCMIQAVILTSILFVPTAPKRLKLLAGGTLVLVLGALLVTGSRTPLLIYMLCFGLALFYMGRLSTIGGAAVVAYAVGTAAFTYFGAGVSDRVGSVLSEENYDRFRNTALGGIFWDRMIAEPLGQGLGVATIAARHFTDWSQIYFVESYVALIAEETGVLGFIALIWMSWSIVTNLLRERTLIRQVDWSPFWIFIVLLVFEMIALLPSGALIDSAPGNLYFWFLIGVAVRLADLARATVPSAAYARAPQATPTYAYPSQWSTPQ
jgi:hypothetical protein